MPAFGRGTAPGTTGNGHVIQDEGVSLTQRTKLNFVGDGVAVTDDSVGDASTVTVIGAEGMSIADPRIGVAQGSLLRTYSFDSDAQGWVATASGGAVTYDSGLKAIRFDPHSTNQTYALDPGPAVTNGEFVVDMSILHGTPTSVADVGIIFRRQDDNNHYMLALRSFQYTGGTTAMLFKRVGGTYTTISDTDTLSAHEIQVGHNARFRVLVRFLGAQISWFINEAFAGAVSDSTYIAGGPLGARLSSGTSGSSMYIYQAAAYSLSPTWEPGLYGSGGSGVGGSEIDVLDEGVAVSSRATIDFVGSGVSATDDAVSGKTIITIPGGGAAASGMIEGVGITKITVSSTQPSSPTTGDLWYKRS